MAAVGVGSPKGPFTDQKRHICTKVNWVSIHVSALSSSLFMTQKVFIVSTIFKVTYQNDLQHATYYILIAAFI